MLAVSGNDCVSLISDLEINAASVTVQRWFDRNSAVWNLSTFLTCIAQVKSQEADDPVTYSFTSLHTNQPNHTSCNLHVEIVLIELLPTRLAAPCGLVAASLLNLSQAHYQLSVPSCRFLRIAEHIADLCAQVRCWSFIRDNYCGRSGGFARS